MKIAIVNNNIVEEIRIIRDEDYHNIQCQIAIDITDSNPQPEIGWILQGSRLVGLPVSTRITRLAMRQRFRISELIALETAAQTDMFIKVLMGNLAVSTFIALQRPDTIAAVNTLAELGYITTERATEILTTPPTALELYKGP